MSVWRGGMGRVGLLGGQVPAVEPIYPNPVITPEMAAAMYARTGVDGMSGLGCTNPEICWSQAWNGAEVRGQDVDYAIAGLNGIGDFYPAQFPVPQNPIVPGMAGLAGRGSMNGMLNGLRGLRGLGAFDTSSLANFATSVESGSSTLLGVTLPNYAWLGLGVLGVALLGSKSRGRH